MSRIDITQNDLAAVQEKIQRATGTAHRLLATEVWGNIRQNAPQDQGRLAGSFHLSGGDTESTIGSNVEYAAVQEEGSSPYTIYPRSARVLAFNVGGMMIFATRVDHPGVPAKRYIEKSIEEGQARIPTFVSQALRREGLL